jgi:hypothetical protein
MAVSLWKVCSFGLVQTSNDYKGGTPHPSIIYSFLPPRAQQNLECHAVSKKNYASCSLVQIPSPQSQLSLARAPMSEISFGKQVRMQNGFGLLTLALISLLSETQQSDHTIPKQWTLVW